MNLGAHIAVAWYLQQRRSGGADTGGPADGALLLGTALPDLAAMGRFRLSGRTEHPGVQAGIQLHYRTDEAFHRHRWFLDRQRSLVQDLTRLGLARGPARACGHAGIELLLDGALLADGPVVAATRSAFDTIPRIRPQLVELVDGSHRARWLSHLDRLAGRPPLRALDDPREVAERLHRILAGRPRLAFDQAQLPALVGALERQQAEVTAGSAEVVRDLVDQLA
jgi:hypothetical protein